MDSNVSGHTRAATWKGKVAPVIKVACVVGLAGSALAAYLLSCTRSGDSVSRSQANQIGELLQVAASPDLDAKVAEARSLIAGSDFNSALAGAPVCLDDPEDLIRAPFDEVYDRLRPAGTYSRGERMLLGGWRDEEGGHQNLCATFDVLRMYYEAHGYLPQDGAELAGWVELGPGRSNLDGLVEATRRTDRLSRFGYAINPLTGRFYSSFDKDEWHPGGVYLKPDLSFDELEAAFDGRYGFEECLGGNFRGAWLLKVFGDSPDELLAFKPLVMLDRSGRQSENQQIHFMEAPPEWKHSK